MFVLSFDTRTLEPQAGPRQGVWCMVCTEESELESLRPIWEELKSDARQSCPYHQWDYVVAWWEAFGRTCPRRNIPGRLHVVVVYEDSKPIGFFPWFHEVRPGWALGVRRLRALGYSGELGASDMTEEPLAMVRRGFEAKALEAAVRTVRAGFQRNLWDAVSLRLQFPESESIFRRSWGFLSKVKIRPASQIVTMAPTWDAFRKSLSKSMRDNLPYYPRLLERHGHSWEVRVVSDPSEVEDAARELIKLHKARVKADKLVAHDDHFPSVAQEEFIVDVHKRLGPSRRGFIGLLMIDGEAAAAQSFFEDDDELLVSYSGFDPKWYAYSPLFVLESEIMKGALTRGVRRVNLLQGKSPWQLRWKPEQESTVTMLTLTRIRPMSMLRVGLEFATSERTKFFRRTKKKFRTLMAKFKRKAEAK